MQLVDEKPLIEMKNFSYMYPGASEPVLKNISLRLEAKESLAILGESGSGKSTLARIVAQLIPTTNKSGYLSRNCENIQFIFQDSLSSFNPRKRLGFALTEPLRIKSKISQNEAWKLCESLLEKMGLDRSISRSYIHEFSGGQRQRFNILRALSTSPQVVIADEAVSALDVSVQAQILNLLKDLKEELGFSLLFISHDIAITDFMCDRAILMRKGEIDCEGDLPKLFIEKNSDYLKKLLEAKPKFD